MSTYRLVITRAQKTTRGYSEFDSPVKALQVVTDMAIGSGSGGWDYVKIVCIDIETGIAQWTLEIH